MSEEAEMAERAVEEGLKTVPLPPSRLSRRERREQEARVRRFLALSPALQEGLLRCGERIRSAYLTKFR